MKCEMIQDILPLYIDGLTSEESNEEIENHLKSCKNCKRFYQEMIGEISETVSISDEEFQEVELIKKMKKRKRKGIIGGIIGAAVLILVAFVLIWPNTYSEVKYEDVTLTYGARGDTAYMTIETKPGYDIVMNGSGGGKNSYLKMLSVKRTLGTGNGTMGWESDIGTKEDPCRWTIEFKDKIVVFENGELVEEKDR